MSGSVRWPLVLNRRCLLLRTIARVVARRPRALPAPRSIPQRADSLRLSHDINVCESRLTLVWSEIEPLYIYIP